LLEYVKNFKIVPCHFIHTSYNVMM